MIPIDTARILGELKPFQRDTVDYVFQRMYGDTPPTRRFLVADEVGLGKTMVARGLIARAIEHLRAKNDRRVDIVYICSNASIAQQNIASLNLTDRREQTLPDRITLLPRDLPHLSPDVNFISFTPGTSFNVRGGTGRWEERTLLYWMLPKAWKTGDPGVVSLLAGGVERTRFQERVKAPMTLNDGLRESFEKALNRVGDAAERDGQPTLQARFLELSQRLGRKEKLGEDESRQRKAIVGELRGTLARTCVNALEPDLIILDEFQRFKDLLHGDDPAAELARALFDYADKEGRQQARVLLLSATPYKMYTLHEDAEGDDHFGDFIKTLEFLHGGSGEQAEPPEAIADIRRLLSTYGQQLFTYNAQTADSVVRRRQEIENRLRRVMVRTERLAVTEDRSGMLVDVPPTLQLRPADVSHYLALQRIGRAVGHGDTLEYWKSASYLLNFMDDYQLKRQVLEAVRGPGAGTALQDALRSVPDAILSRTDIESYRLIDPANARLRALLAVTLDRGVGELFWIPPALPYYGLEGPFANADHATFTKSLVFSAWQVVPKVVATLLSYEAERRLFGVPLEGEPAANTRGTRRGRSRLLQFRDDGGRPGGMTTLGLMYPSIVLAQLCDPLAIASDLRRHQDGILPSLDSVREETERRVERALRELPGQEQATGRADERWYWAAPILLDLHRHNAATRAWFEQPRLATDWRGEGSDRRRDLDEDVGALAEESQAAGSAWAKHVAAAKTLVEGGVTLGLRPADLAQVVAWLAIGGPAVTALRALCRVVGGLHLAPQIATRNAAGRVADALRSLFNEVEVISAITRTTVIDSGEAYWRRVLEYAARGGLQAVLDEYAHFLSGAIGDRDRTLTAAMDKVAGRMVESVTIMTATLTADDVQLDATGHLPATQKLGFRTRFAVSYGGQGLEDVRGVDRNRSVQRAFNSPFWPFVLCSTSVGQEGLDFHPYCHAVVHWNVPSNPVDLEQREGRVHRYKGHAVRKNVARKHGAAVLTAGEGPDPWARMFAAAEATDMRDDSGLSPYWLYLVDDPGAARIERHVLALPLSRDAARADAIRRSLAVYRMAFGQARQQDVVDFLLQQLDEPARKRAAEDLRINLTPPPSVQRKLPGFGTDLAGDRGAVRTEPDRWSLTTSMGPAPMTDQVAALLDRYAELRGVARRDGRRLPKAMDVAGLRELLHQVGAMQAQAGAHGVDRGRARETTVSIERLREVLDQFIALPEIGKAIDATMAVSPALGGEADMTVRLRELLDMFVRTRPDVVPHAGVEGYHALLNEFVRIRT
ncbi:MAG: DEAD/DEAH box helicase [Candidatus Rokubacteria bacterium]|nr:DEAD/DEAH box helicase [Candidatus Rokubacteria bacterium]